MVISSRQKLQSLNDYTMNIHKDGVPINQSNQSKSLGLIIDEDLSWKALIDFMKSLKKRIGALKRVRTFVSMHTAIKVYKGLIEPHFDYCSAYGMVWPKSLVRNFKNFKIVLSELSLNLAMIRVPDVLILNSLGWDNLSVRRAKQKANLRVQVH